MTNLPDVISPDRWIIQIFSARAAAEGGILRRKVADVERLVGRERFYFEVKRRGYHVIESSGQFLVFCNQDPVHVIH